MLTAWIVAEEGNVNMVGYGLGVTGPGLGIGLLVAALGFVAYRKRRRR